MWEHWLIQHVQGCNWYSFWYLVFGIIAFSFWLCKHIYETEMSKQSNQCPDCCDFFMTASCLDKTWPFDRIKASKLLCCFWLKTSWNFIQLTYQHDIICKLTVTRTNADKTHWIRLSERWGEEYWPISAAIQQVAVPSHSLKRRVSLTSQQVAAVQLFVQRMILIHCSRLPFVMQTGQWSVQLF